MKNYYGLYTPKGVIITRKKEKCDYYMAHMSRATCKKFNSYNDAMNYVINGFNSLNQDSMYIGTLCNKDWFHYLNNIRKDNVREVDMITFLQ